MKKIVFCLLASAILCSCSQSTETEKESAKLVFEPSYTLPIYTYFKPQQIDGKYYLESSDGSRKEIRTSRLNFEYDFSTAGKKTVKATQKDEPYQSTTFEVDVKESKLIAKDIPEEDKAEVENKGTIERLTYKTNKYNLDGTAAVENIDAACYIYLPYGYTPTKQYNILYLLHGKGEDEAYWLGQEKYVDYQENQTTAKVLNNLISKGEINDLIVCTPSLYNQYTEADDVTSDDLYPYQYEFKNDLIPAVESVYSTYATGTTAEELKAARDHRAYAGLSMGSMTSYAAILTQCLDYVSYVGSFHACKLDENRYDELINSIDSHKINFWYNGAGTNDSLHDEHLASYKNFLNRSTTLKYGEDIANGENTVFVSKYEYAHNYSGWSIDFYNCLKLFF